MNVVREGRAGPSAGSRGALSLERIRRDGELFMQEIARELYLAGAGHKATAELQPVYKRHEAILGSDALGIVLEAFRGASEGSEEHRATRMLLEWEVESQSSRQLAELDEREIAWEASATVRVSEGQSIPYQRATIEMANAPDRAQRLAVERARAKLVGSELAPLRRERFQRERDIVEALGVGDGFNDTFERLSGISLSQLGAACERFLRDTQAMWDDVLPGALASSLGIGVHEATRADALALFRAREYDAAFPSGTMEEAIRGQVREMGIDYLATGRIVVDLAEREGKRSRAFCAPVRVPDEVYLVLRPHGGQTDWSTFLHELGHALHFAYMRPGLGFEYRWLGDNSITEGYAMLFDHLMQDGRWLARYSSLGGGKERVRDFLRTNALEELHFLRRYCAKFLYEIELYGGTTRWDALPDLYVSRMTAATNFRYDPADAFVDVDPRYYAARYLRAWQLQALITETLVEQYDEDWWRNPRAGPWLCQALFGEGQRELAPEQAQRIAGKELSFEPLVRAVERALS